MKGMVSTKTMYLRQSSVSSSDPSGQSSSPSQCQASDTHRPVLLHLKLCSPQSWAVIKNILENSKQFKKKNGTCFYINNNGIMDYFNSIIMYITIL